MCQNNKEAFKRPPYYGFALLIECKDSYFIENIKILLFYHIVDFCEFVAHLRPREAFALLDKIIPKSFEVVVAPCALDS